MILLLLLYFFARDILLINGLNHTSLFNDSRKNYLQKYAKGKCDHYLFLIGLILENLHIKTSP